MCTSLRPYDCRFIAPCHVCLCVDEVVGWDATFQRLSALCPYTLALYYLIPGHPSLSPRLHCDAEAKYKHTLILSFFFFPPLLGCGCVRSPCLLQCVPCSFSPSLFCPMRCCSPSRRVTTCSGSMDRSSTVHLTVFIRQQHKSNS